MVINKRGSLKGSLSGYVHSLVGDGVAELQTFGMKIKTISCLSVERISYDGAVHAIGMCGVYAQLVGATGFGVVGNAGSSFMVIHNLITRDCWLSIFIIDYL